MKSEVLHEFDRAIALGAADQAQRLLDRFRHGMVKSWAEPPMCQCGCRKENGI